MPRARYVDLVGKGIEELKSVPFGPLKTTVTTQTTAVQVLGPWEVDYDVVEVVVVSETAVSSGANTFDVFKGAISGAAPIITQFDPDTLSTGVPVTKAVTNVANARIPAGTQITVRLVVAVGDATEDVSGVVRMERVIGERGAKDTTYGAYPR